MSACTRKLQSLARILSSSQAAEHGINKLFLATARQLQTWSFF